MFHGKYISVFMLLEKNFQIFFIEWARMGQVDPYSTTLDDLCLVIRTKAAINEGYPYCNIKLPYTSKTL